MWHFLKTIRLSFRYKWTILASVLNALVVGTLWSASITAVYPFVEVVFKGETLDTWLASETDQARATIQTLNGEIQQLREQQARAGVGQDADLETQIGRKESRLHAESRALEWYESLKPWVAGRMPRTPFGTLLFVLVLLIAVTVVKGVCLVLNVVLEGRVVNRTIQDLRRIFYRAALEMDQDIVERRGATQIMTMIAHNVNLVGAGLKSLYGTSIREPLKMLTCLAAAAFISWRLLVLSLLLAPVGALLVHYLSRRMRRAALGEMGGISAIFETLTETLNGIKIVKIFNRERRERARFKRDTQSLYKMSMRMSFYDALIRPSTELVSVLAIGVALLAGAYLVLNQETHVLGIRISDRPLSASTLFVFYAMLAGISDPARKMSEIYNTLVRGAVASQSLFTFFDEPPRVTAARKDIPVPLHSKSIRFDTVNFAYRPHQTILKKITLTIPFGQIVALVGHNGCGKTTLVNLIARFYDPQWGSIFLDDVNLKDLNPKRLRRQMGMITQDPVLFQGTIWENIAYGAPTASAEKVRAAARLGHVDDFIGELPDGYQTQVGEQGRSLSGGQRQRITLARAILADPRILIFDEATSQIDQHTEQLIHVALRQFLKGRTAILISHRTSTIELADRVLVMEQGRIVRDVLAAEYLRQVNDESPMRSAA